MLNINMKKEIEFSGPKKSTIDKLLAYSKSIKNVNTQKKVHKVFISLN